MICPDWHNRLLEADPEELRGTRRTVLTEHLDSCPACHALAHCILADEDRLRDALASLVPHRPLEAAVEAAARSARRQRRRRWMAAAIPTAAAAALAALLIGPRNAPTTTTFGSSVGHRPALVESTPNQDVVIYQTANPDIVVVWLYHTNGS